MRSKLSIEVHTVLREIFPEAKIILEKYVNYKGQKLYLDFWMPQFGLVIEVHGGQHDKFNRHFHRDAQGYRAHKQRDSLKEEWAQLEGLTFVAIRTTDFPLTAPKLLTMISEKQNE
jgi:very-short-patch-repair endonuclease